MRTLMQCYVKEQKEAIESYLTAFDGEKTFEDVASDGTIIHCELTLKGQVVAVGQVDELPVTGTTMQFCFQMDTAEEVQRAYEELKTGAQIYYALGPCFFSPCMSDLIDRFGVRWCLFV